MMNPNEEISIICRLTGSDPAKIEQRDDGFLSRAYLIENGKIVFKFKKEENADYGIEEQMLNFIGTLSLPVKVQKVGWTSPDYSYIGLYGIIGNNLENLTLTSTQKDQIGMQLGECLKILHQAKCDQAQPYSLASEIDIWQQRFEYSIPTLREYFSPFELNKIDDLMMREMPSELRGCGEKMVLSHGDLSSGNIVVDDQLNVGIIDFSEMLYLDEAADFMDIGDEEICRSMLDTYGAGGNLRRKVSIRRLIRPVYIIGTYAGSGRKKETDQLASMIRRTIL